MDGDRQQSLDSDTPAGREESPQNHQPPLHTVVQIVKCNNTTINSIYMKVLVTGGAGFIGSNLCEHLLATGHTVRCLDNFATGKPENVFPLLENIRMRLPCKSETSVIYRTANKRLKGWSMCCMRLLWVLSPAPFRIR